MKVILTVIVGLLMMGCAKGDKGDAGVSAVTSIKTYSGTPTSNPFTIALSPAVDLEKQVLEVYADGGDRWRVPFKYGTTNHTYYVTGGGTQLTIKSVNDNGTLPSTVFNTGIQFDYLVYVKTFSSAQAKQAYVQSLSPAKTTYERLIYGAD